MSQKPSPQPPTKQAAPAVPVVPSTPRPAPWTRDGQWVLNAEGRPICMLLPTTTDEPKRLLAAACDTAWQRDELLLRLRDVATAPGLEGPAVEAARALLATIETP
ncbi:MAG: hypothetical protein ACLQIJ_06530 [Polyangia bacterium]